MGLRSGILIVGFAAAGLAVVNDAHASTSSLEGGDEKVSIIKRQTQNLDQEDESLTQRQHFNNLFAQLSKPQEIPQEFPKPLIDEDQTNNNLEIEKSGAATIESDKQNNSKSNGGDLKKDITVNQATNKALEIKPPSELKLKANVQRYDLIRKRFIAEGDVFADLNGGTLQADRIEFDREFNTLFAIGSVRLRRGSQYFQASKLRYNLTQKEGELEDVYGILDLDTADLDLSSNNKELNPTKIQKPLPVLESEGLDFPTSEDLLLNSSTAEGISPQGDTDMFWDQEIEAPEAWMAPINSVPSNASSTMEMACPPLIPPIPNWHPHPWAATAWGGQMIDSNFGDTFIFNGRMRPEYLLGVGIQKRLWKSGPIAIEFETDFFAHQANRQAGGRYNQDVPFSDTPSQTFGEGVIGLGARLWVQPWLSLGVVEGISYNTSVSNYEKTYRKKFSQLLNYLGFEIEASFSDQISMVGRIHHRSGAFGTYNGVKEGSNGYLLGVRYRWGKSSLPQSSAVVPPPLGCPDPDRDSRDAVLTMNERLEQITLGNGQIVAKPKQQDKLAKTFESNLSPAEQEAIRAEAIAGINQRITSIELQQRLTLERRAGVPESARNVDEENRYGGKNVKQLERLGRAKLITGVISRWRVQAAKVIITQEGWRSDRMGFTNDPYTPAQTRIDAEDIVAKEQPNGDISIKSRRNRLIVEDRLVIPVSRTQKIEKEEEVENRWVLGFDQEDRDGFFIGRTLKEIRFSDGVSLSLEPQFLLQRAYNGNTDSYIAPGSSIDSRRISQANTAGDLFGLEAKLEGKALGWNIETNLDASTFNPSNFSNGLRSWGTFKKAMRLPLIGDFKTRVFGAYRYRTWNGSLGETDIYSAYGAFAEREGGWKWGDLSNNYIWRLGAGNYQAEKFNSNNLTNSWRANFYGSLNSSYPLWTGSPAKLTPEAAYRYSPIAIVPGLKLRTNINSLIAVYGDGRKQNTLSLSGGPTLTLGTFSKPFLDYTRLSISGGGTLKQGSSPFDFDQAIDLGSLGIGLTQQIAGPLLFNAGVALNVDPGSEFYGNVINSNLELRWQRRSYDVGIYYNPYEGIAGFRVRLNDFNFTGTGVPFIPYTPTNSIDPMNQDRSLF